MSPQSSDYEPLAIVGIGCRLPGQVGGPRDFWRLLKDGQCGIREVPEERWSIARFYDRNPMALGKASTKWGGFVDGIRDFDAEFFGISPAEAEAMDPQQRMLLIAAWEAFEDAGVPLERLRGSNTSVFVGISGVDYTQAQRFRRTGENIYAGTGGTMSIAANRISHKFDLRGPSMAVDSACSSSLVATDLACHTIWRGQSDVAIAAGVNALLDPGVFVNFSRANMMSRTGRIRTFDADADGYVRGEGAGVVVIKRLSQAVSDGDRVYAVIRGTAVNQDGRTSTITVPSAEAQTDMLRQASSRAAISETDIDYVEAHGTGTPVGDPIEARAIGAAFGMRRNRRNKVIVGAGKTNTGHLESAAGITGLIKTSLCLHHREIPRNLNFKKPNPNIPLDDLGLELPLQHRAWTADNGRARRAAVNSFGFGGTNACAILEEAPQSAQAHGRHDHPYRRTVFLPLGAQSETALRRLAGATADHLRQQPRAQTVELVAANFATRRSHLSVRAATLARTPAEVIDILESAAKPANDDTKRLPGIIIGRRLSEPRVVMAFSGQGGAWWGMGHGLMKHDPVFRAAVAEIDRHFAPLAGWSVGDELLRAEGDYRASSAYSLPCLFALQVGLLARWKAWGIEPALVIGHSSGEMATAYAAGILPLDELVRIVHHRARLQASQEGRGSLAAIALSRSAAESDLAAWGLTRVDIAAINGASMVNIAGDIAEVDRAIALFKEKYGEDLFARTLRVEFAPHSHHMDPIHEQFIAALGTVTPSAGKVPMISTVTGHMLVGQMADAGYWWRNIRDTVQFDRGLREALRLGGNIFLEIGPHANLSAMIASSAAERGDPIVVLNSLHREQRHDQTLPSSLGSLYVAGVEPDWRALFGAHVPRIDLPSNPWETKPYWIEPEEASVVLHGPRSHPMLGQRAFGPMPLWTSELSLEEHKFLIDHTIDGSVIFPGAAYLEIMFAAARELFGDGSIELENVEILDAMILSSERTELVQTTYEPARGRVSIHSRARGSNLDWTLRARAIARVVPKADTVPHRAVKPPARRHVAGQTFYRGVAARGYAYGPTFRGVRKLWPGKEEATAVIACRAIATRGFNFHPALLDSVQHVAFGIRLEENLATNRRPLFLPVRLERVVLHQAPGSAPLYARARSVSIDARTAISDIILTTERGEPILDIEGFTSRAINSRVATTTAELVPRFVIEEWVETAGKVAQGRKPGRGQTWLVFQEAGKKELTAQTAASLAEAGARVITVMPGPGPIRGAGTSWKIRPDTIGDFEALLLGALKGRTKKLAGIVFGWGLAGYEQARDLDPTTLQAIERCSTLPALLLLQALAKRPELRPRLWFFTRGAFNAGPMSRTSQRLAAAMAGAPLAGFARTALTEYPDLHCSVIDFDGNRGDALRQARSLARVLLGQTDETEIALRGQAWFVPRLHMPEAAALPALRAPSRTANGTRAYRVGMHGAGDLHDLRLMETAIATPRRGEVKIKIMAGGLNFRDVMAATGLLPADAESGDAAQALGLECSGVVAEVGSGVRSLRVGDRVMVTAKGAFASEIVVPAEAAHVFPKRISFIAAATVSSAFGTAYYALKHLARVRRDETVLIHLGTGGVGLAAIQIARHFGAKIIATAGSPAKRAYLRRLGIKHVFDSRSLSFAAQARRATGGRGVDVVLNSLAGEAIPLALSLLAPNGRFVEIGKRDIYGDSSLGLRAMRRNASVFVLDMARMDQDDPSSLAEVYREVLALIERGKLKPLPATVFPVERIADAFETMAKAKHIGKVVIDFDRPRAAIDLSSSLPLKPPPRAAYLIAGGLGGFGAEVARWLADQGARRLYLLSRRGRTDPGAAALIEDLARRGARAVALAVDVTNRKDVTAAVTRIAKDNVELRGVIHSAMVLDDGFINQLDAGRLHKVLAPKALGAWNLHCASQDAPLDFFVMFSSMASTIGSAGQANYVAANRFLDLFAAHRRRLGLPAMAINWGSLGGAGAVQRNKAILKYLKTMGMPPVELEQALAGLSTLLRKDSPAVGFCKIDWPALLRANPTIGKTPRFGEVTGADAKGTGGGRIRTELAHAEGAARQALLRDYLARQIARVLKIDAKSLDAARPLNELGLDSLTSFQLKNKIESEVGVSLPVGKFLQKPTVESLVVAVDSAFEASLQEAKGGTDGQADGTAASLQVSPRQDWLWRNLHKDGPAPRHGNNELVYAIRITAPIDAERLDRAWRATVSSHDVLRSIFPAARGAASVALLPIEQFSVRVHDVSDLDASGVDAKVRALANTPHDLERGPIADLHLLRLPRGQSVLMLRSHVMLTDGWSLNMLLRDVFQAYFGLTPAPADAAPKTPEPGYFDFARWHRAWLDGPDGKKARAFWREKLAALPPPARISATAPEQVDVDALTTTVRRFLPAAEAPPLREIARQLGVSLHALMMAVFHAVIHGICGADDLVIATNSANRTRSDDEKLVGWFTNQVLIRSNLDPAATLQQHAQIVSQGMAELADHALLPLHHILDAAGENNRRPIGHHFLDLSMMWPDNGLRSGFEEVMFSPLGTVHRFGDIEMSVVLLGVERPGLLLRNAQLVYQEIDGALLLMLNSRDGVFEEGKAEAFLDRYVRALAAGANNPDCAIAELGHGD